MCCIVEGGTQKMMDNMTVLRMGLPIVENLSGLQESIFSLFRGSQRNSRKKIKIDHFLLSNSSHSPYFPTLGKWLFGVYCCGHPGLQ